MCASALGIGEGCFGTRFALPARFPFPFPFIPVYHLVRGPVRLFYLSLLLHDGGSAADRAGVSFGLVPGLAGLLGALAVPASDHRQPGSGVCRREVACGNPPTGPASLCPTGRQSYFQRKVRLHGARGDSQASEGGGPGNPSCCAGRGQGRGLDRKPHGKLGTSCFRGAPGFSLPEQHRLPTPEQSVYRCRCPRLAGAPRRARL